MGLFSKKPKAPEYDPADCAAKKKRLREIFKEALIKAGKSQANRRRQWKRPIKDHIGG